MKLGIVGSRRRNTSKDKIKLKLFLIKALKIYPELSLISGGCPKGADRFAEELAIELNLKIIIHYPNKTKLPPNPQKYDFAKINYSRNTLIANDCDILVALVAQDRKGGTEDTIKKAKFLNKKIILL